MKRTRIDDRAFAVSYEYEFRRKFRNPALLYRNSFWALLLVGLLAGLSGCVSSEKLQKNQYLLYSQTVRGNRTLPSADLEALIPQRPNRRILRLPITFGLWAYQLGAKTYDKEAAQRALDAKRREYDQFIEQPDSTKSYKKQLRRFNRQLTRLRRQVEEGNWVMRNLGEPPVYFYEADAKTNAEKMQRYLRNKGFLRGNATYAVDSTTTLGRRVRVTYTIRENIPFYLNQITYQITDSRVDSLVRKTLDRSVLKSGDRFDADNVEAERIRIEELLRNNGYYSFSRQYIPLPLDVLDLDADSSATDSTRSAAHRLNMWVKIVNPPGKSSHPVFKIGEVDVFVARGEDRATLDTVRYNGLRYLLGRQNYAMRLLDSRIFLRPDSLYRLRNFQDSQRQLFLLNQFRFANISFTDTTGSRLRTRINLIPIDKYELTTEGGIFVLYQGQGYPGPFGNLSFRVHNVFGGLGTFETAVRYGIEATTGFVPNSPIGISQEFGLNTSLIFPHILFPGKVRFQFNRLSPRTQISLGYNYTKRPEYGRQLLRAALSYNWLKNNNHQYNFFLADVNYLNATINRDENGQSFQNYLDTQAAAGSTIKNSFRSAFASNIGFVYTYNTNILGQNRRANFLRVSLESGGTTLNLFSEDQLQKIFKTTETSGLQYYKYLRANVDFRHYVPLRSKTTAAFRLNTGLVYGYGANGTAPYEKLFFAGGSSSIRAWLPRRLGPGASVPYTLDDEDLVPDFKKGSDGKPSGQFRYDFEQPGDILLEASAEVRTHLFHLGGDINGAFFIDAGNVWTLSDIPSQKRENFSRNFLQQIAVGTGIGLRIDFSFFIIRFDGAIKVYDPSRYFLYNPSLNGYFVEGKKPGIDFIDERFFLPKFRLDKLFKGPNPLVINFGIGYPF